MDKYQYPASASWRVQWEKKKWWTILSNYQYWPNNRSILKLHWKLCGFVEWNLQQEEHKKSPLEYLQFSYNASTKSNLQLMVIIIAYSSSNTLERLLIY